MLFLLFFVAKLVHNLGSGWQGGGAAMRLYHTGKSEIRIPILTYGRKNADFGQGFYLTPDMDFAHRWAKAGAIVNEYEFSGDGLDIIKITRNEEWFDYIFHNRRGADKLSADAVMGPIANDTIYDTFGVVSCGFLKPADAMKLLMIGPSYIQIALKTERALKNLRWLNARKIERMDKEKQQAEQESYSVLFAKAMQDMDLG